MACRPRLSFNPLTLYSDQREVKSYWGKLIEFHECTRCEKPFNLLTSMGTFGCTQHPGLMQENGTYSCCGQRDSPLRYINNIELVGMYPSNNNFGRMNGYCVRNQQPLPIRRRGCQRCDCNTGNNPWKHSNRIHISELAPLIPFIRKEAEKSNGVRLVQRVGFDNGYIRRCEILPLQRPDGEWHTITYESVEGKVITTQYENREELPKYGTSLSTRT